MTKSKGTKKLKQYECGAFRFTDQTDHEHYDRHLVFDHAVSPEDASQRERFEAVARSLRDLLVSVGQEQGQIGGEDGARWRVAG
jgi:starch phosphorylase